MNDHILTETKRHNVTNVTVSFWCFLLERRHSSSSFGLIHVSAQLDEGDVVKAISRTLWAAAFTFPETGRGTGCWCRGTEELSDLGKVIQPDQTRTGVCWPPCLSTAKMIQSQEK